MTKTKKKSSDVNKLDGFAGLSSRFEKSEDLLFAPLEDEIKIIPTGCIVWDYCTSVGGFPMGRMVELHGKESAGKTTLAIGACVQMQQAGYPVLFADFEHAFDAVYAKSLGLSFDKSMLSVPQPLTLEEGADAIFQYVDLGTPLFIVIDSLPAMIPAKLFNSREEWGKNPGLQSRLTSDFLSALTKKARASGSGVLILNQMRAKFNVMFGQSPDEASGGYAVKHYLSASFTLQKGLNDSDSSNAVDEFGNKVKVINWQQVKIKAKKNKVGIPNRSGVIYMKVGGGVDNVRSIVDAAIQSDLIQEPKKSRYVSEYLGEDFKAHGIKQLCAIIEENAHYTDSLLSALDWLNEDGNIDMRRIFKTPSDDEFEDPDSVEELEEDLNEVISSPEEDEDEN